LKFIPRPFVKGAKAEALKDFDELARKMRCRYLYHDNSNEIHPFKSKTGYTLPPACGVLENYIYKTRHELSSLQVRKFRDNLNAMERVSISSLKKDKDIIIKTSDKGNNIVILDKHNYLSEAYRQLNSQHYVRYIKNTNNQDDLQRMLTQFKLNLIKRGYKENEIMKCINEALTKNGSDLINQNKTKQNKEIPLVLSSRYKPP
jgi:hypothetical protein